MNRRIDDDTWEALNAFADGELVGVARAHLERRLTHEPVLGAALSEIRALKETLAGTAPWSFPDDSRRPPAVPVAPTPRTAPRAPRLRSSVPFAALALGTLVLGIVLVLVPRDGTLALAALPAGLHGALHEPDTADAMPPPPAEADGSRLLAGHRFPDLGTRGVRPARVLVRDTPRGAAAAALYLGPNGCDFTLGVVPAGMPPVTGDVPRAGAGPDAPARATRFTAGFGPTVLVRAWSAGDDVWVASSDAIDPARFAALADLARERTGPASVPRTVVRIARADDAGGRTSCGTG